MNTDLDRQEQARVDREAVRREAAAARAEAEAARAQAQAARQTVEIKRAAAATAAVQHHVRQIWLQFVSLNLYFLLMLLLQIYRRQ